MEPFLLEPIYERPVWSNNRLSTLRDVFDHEPVGCSWEVSAHPHGSNKILNGPYAGQDLTECLQSHPELLGKADWHDLLRCAISDASQVLSIQNHPDDAYAMEHEHDNGKTESWYVLDAGPGAFLYAGCTADSKEQVKAAALDGTIVDLLVPHQVKAGDFIQIQSGELHALGADIMILEVANNSNTTYRLYDHGRKGREMHLEKGLDILDLSAESPVHSFPVEEAFADAELVSTGRYTEHLHDIQGEAVFPALDVFSTLHVAHGTGQIELASGPIPLGPTQSLFVPAGTPLKISGNLRVLRAWPTVNPE